MSVFSLVNLHFQIGTDMLDDVEVGEACWSVFGQGYSVLLEGISRVYGCVTRGTVLLENFISREVGQ